MVKDAVKSTYMYETATTGLVKEICNFALV